MREALTRRREAHENAVELCRSMREELLNLPGVRVYTPEGASLVTFNVEGIGSQELSSLLDGGGIAVRGGLHCAPGVHRFLGTLETGAVRASPGMYSAREEVLRLVRCVYRVTK